PLPCAAGANYPEISSESPVASQVRLEDWGRSRQSREADSLQALHSVARTALQRGRGGLQCNESPCRHDRQAPARRLRKTCGVPLHLREYAALGGPTRQALNVSRTI